MIIVVITIPGSAEAGLLVSHNSDVMVMMVVMMMMVVKVIGINNTWQC